VYNKTVARIKGGESHKNFIKLRNEILAKPQPEWAKGKDKVARTIQDYAVKQATDAYKTNEAKQKKNNSNFAYNVKFKSLKSYTEIIAFAKDPPEEKMSFLLRFEAVAVPSEALRGGRAECNTFFGNNMKGVSGVRLEDRVGTVRRLVSEGNRLRENGKIQWDKRTKKFYFIYTFEQPAHTDWDPQFLSKRVVATDPGASPFHAWYSPTTGEYGELLQGARSELEDQTSHGSRRDWTSVKSFLPSSFFSFGWTARDATANACWLRLHAPRIPSTARRERSSSWRRSLGATSGRLTLRKRVSLRWVGHKLNAVDQWRSKEPGLQTLHPNPYGPKP
jgi:hypothetical protein